MTYVLLFTALLSTGQVATHSQIFESGPACVAAAEEMRVLALQSALTADAAAMCFETKLDPDRKSKPI